MLILPTDTSLVQLITDATPDIDVQASFVDHTAPDTFVAGSQSTLITTATTTTIVGSPATSVKRNVRGLWIRNAHLTTANAVTVVHNNGTTSTRIFKCILGAGETLVIPEQGVPFVFDAAGGVKMGASAASDTIAGIAMTASVAEMESALDSTKIVTPGRQHNHPGHPKFWVKAGITGNILASYNVTSLTDTGVGLMTVTIGTDFSSANWCCQATVERAATALTVANIRSCAIRNALQAAGTVQVEC